MNESSAEHMYFPPVNRADMNARWRRPYVMLLPPSIDSRELPFLYFTFAMDSYEHDV